MPTGRTSDPSYWRSCSGLVQEVPSPFPSSLQTTHPPTYAYKLFDNLLSAYNYFVCVHVNAKYGEVPWVQFFYRHKRTRLLSQKPGDYSLPLRLLFFGSDT